jgi:TPR repeat protein
MAEEWFRQAATAGNASAQRNLGTLYELGVALPQSDVEALKWYRRAAAQGNEKAAESVRRLEDTN